jgi:hypothetical protein
MAPPTWRGLWFLARVHFIVMALLRNCLGVVALMLSVAVNAATLSFERAPAMMYQSGMSLEQAIVMVQMKYGAKVMKANSVEEGGHLVHYIRLMSQGRVWTVRVDAATGREF